MPDTVTFNPDTEKPEDRFRYLVRDTLGLSWDTRDAAIFAELCRLKKLDDLLAANPISSDAFLASIRT